MGYEGFSGNESILLHLQSPCRLDQVGEFRPIEREEWVPDAHVHRLADANRVEPGGDPVSGRRLLMWNSDIEVSVCKPTEALEGFYRNGEGDEVLYIHRGSGVLRTVFGRVPFRERDYVVIPRGTTHTLRAARGRGAVLALLPHARRDRDAEPLPQPLRPAARARALLAARLPPARGARDLRRERRVPGHRARARRLPGLRARPPPVRRRRLGRLRLAVHVQRRRLRAARRAASTCRRRRTRPSRGRTS